MQNQNINELVSQEIARQLGQAIISNIHLQVALHQLTTKVEEDNEIQKNKS